MRIAVLGGSFDPIHAGHLQIAKQALQQLAIDDVWFMPTSQTPLKDGQCGSFEQRSEMVRRSIQPYRHMSLCCMEGKRSGHSYTIDTVRELQRCYPQHTFSWLIGDDQAIQFAKWKDSEELLSLMPFYVFTRMEHSVLPPELKRITMPLIDISSTQIRNGEHWYQLTAGIARYIGKHGLYLESLVHARMCEKRFQHSVSVAQLCMELAKAHKLDEEVAYRMGILHDIAKEMPYQQAKIWMQHHLPHRMEEAPAIWHGYIGAYMCRHSFYIVNKQILRAIYHHVVGDCEQPYAQILYIADKLDPSRGYDSSAQIALSKRSLQAGFQCVKQEQKRYLEQQGKEK